MMMTFAVLVMTLFAMMFATMMVIRIALRITPGVNMVAGSPVGLGMPMPTYWVPISAMIGRSRRIHTAIIDGP